MGQYWELVNITTREKDASLMGKLGGFFYDQNEFLVGSLIVPFPNEKIKRLHAGKPTPTTGCKLLTLPPELTELIFKQMVRFQDVVCFSLTCKALLAHGEERIQDWLSYIAASWADCRLVCIGDYDHEFLDRLDDAHRREIEQDSNLNPDKPHARDPSLYRYAGEHYSDVVRTKPSQWIKVLPRMKKEDAKRCRAVIEINYGEPRNDWALANCTKGEYVRASAVAALSGLPNAPQPWLQGCGAKLGQVLMARICWSSSDDVNMPYNGGINRGVWAGDMFRITTMDRIARAPGDWVEWTDVSAEVCKELSDIREANLRGGWEYERERPRRRPMTFLSGPIMQTVAFLMAQEQIMEAMEELDIRA